MVVDNNLFDLVAVGMIMVDIVLLDKVTVGIEENCTVVLDIVESYTAVVDKLGFGIFVADKNIVCYNPLGSDSNLLEQRSCRMDN